MLVIDSDAHVEESVDTWKYLDPEFYSRRPIAIQLPEDTCYGDHNAAWIIDYKLRVFAATPTLMKRASAKGASIPVQEMTDIPTRVTAMQGMGADRQVVFPSLWLGCIAENLELEAALARSYNEFMATQCGLSGGSLWYAAVLPFRSPEMAIREIKRVKKMGSVAAIFVKGIEWDMPLSHPSLWPIYEEAERQGLPLAIHTGNGSSPTITQMLDGLPRNDTMPPGNPFANGLVSGPYVLYAFQQLLGSSFMDDFPKLRIGFLETGADWSVRLAKVLRKKKGSKVDEWLGERVFVSCEVDDELPFIINRLGDDFLISATDYPHADGFRADQFVAQLTERGDLSERTVEKILSDNPQRFYPDLG